MLKYSIKLIEKYSYKPYFPEFDELVDHSDTTERSTTNMELAKKILQDFIDPPDYELTDENPDHEFGEVRSKKSHQQIRDYYNIRKLVYSDALDDIQKATKTWNVSSNLQVFTYDIPAECNHYSVIEDDSDNSWEQKEFQIVLKITEV